MDLVESRAGETRHGNLGSKEKSFGFVWGGLGVGWGLLLGWGEGALFGFCGGFPILEEFFCWLFQVLLVLLGFVGWLVGGGGGGVADFKKTTSLKMH